MTTIDIYRPGSPPTLQASPNIDEKTLFTHKLMGEHRITAEFYSGSVLNITIGDYITYGSENFYINRLPDVTKINSSTYQYKIAFESVLYNLSKKMLKSSDGLMDFSYTGSAEDFIDLIITNINEIDPTWTKGTIDTTDDKLIYFTNENCRAALTKIAETFKLEFSLSVRAISLKASAGADTAYSFEYGKDKGLYKLTRQQVNDQNIITKVYGYGGTKNIPSDYRSRAKRLVFDDSGNRYLTKNVSTYGTIEGQFTDDDIYPQRTSTLTGVHMDFDAGGGTDFNNRTSYVEDSTIDFDLNDYLLEGLTGKIVFKSGDLAGIECEIWKYDATNKRIYFNPYSDKDGYTLPSYNGGSPLAPDTGDSYTLVDMEMPSSYVTTAEASLKTATQAFLDKNCIPQVVYDLEFDPKYIKDNSVALKSGDRVTIVDSALSINSLIRISAIEYPLVDPNRIKATIADFVPYTQTERVIKKTIQNKQDIFEVDRTNIELARRNSVVQKQLKDLLFDTDLYFDPTNIKPLSIETAYLAVGTKSQDFWLSNVAIKANYGGDANALYVSTGSLNHLQISITGLGYVWVIGSSLDEDGLTPSTAYYLYAKCSKSALTGEWVLSSSQITVEEVSGYYHFLVGMLFAVADGYRDFDFTKGMVYIHGDQIKAGIVKSIDGLNYFNLTEGKFKIGDTNASLDWNVTTANTLTLKGALAQSPGGTTTPLPVFRGAYNAGTTYYKGDQVTSGGSSWNYINSTPASGQTPSEGAYWTKAAAKGDTGDTGATGPKGDTGDTGATGPAVAYRGEFSASTVYYNNSLLRDIVKNGSTYYFYIGADGQSGAWNPANWSALGASFSSIATGLLLAEQAYIENLGVRYFEGVPVGDGDLHGTLVHTTANAAEVKDEYSIELTSGDNGSIYVNVGGYEQVLDFNVSLDQTAQYAPLDLAWGDCVVTYVTTNTFKIAVPYGTSVSAGANTGNLACDCWQSVYGSAAVAQVDTVTISGTSGHVKITIATSYSQYVEFNESIAISVEEFVAVFGAGGSGYFAAHGAQVTQGGTGHEDDLIFTAVTPGTGFTLTVADEALAFQGSVKITGNDIWEDSKDADNGAVQINLKGFEGGRTKYRSLRIGNGKGEVILRIYGAAGGNVIYVENAAKILLYGLPESSSGCSTNQIYKDGTGSDKALKIH